jgi:hypothetical protein
LKIAFWGNGDYSSGVTSNLACISIASTFEYSYKAILIENHQQKNKLENVLMYNLRYRLRELQYQSRWRGMNHILNYYYMDILARENKECSTNVIKEASLEVLYNKLYYLPTDYVSNHYMYEYNLYATIKELLKELDDFADITYIDTSSHKLSSKIILDEADLIVVNLIQNQSMINDFFENYSSIIHKCVFLVSNYHSGSIININQISKAYLVNPTHIVAIPYNMEYQLALNQGTVVEFLSRNYKCNRQNPNYQFVKQVKLAVKMINKTYISKGNFTYLSSTS